jgi:hypothetical protein
MARFIVGLIAGIILGSIASAYAAGIVGSGSLTGWTVTKDGEEVCSDPDVDRIAKEIACD